MTPTFYSVEDIMEATGCGKTTILNLFNQPDFPLWNIGNKYLVEKHAFEQYCANGVRKEEMYGKH